MVGPPYWSHWILVGRIQCGSLTLQEANHRRDFSPSGPGPEVLAQAGKLGRERTVVEPLGGTLQRNRRVRSFFTSLTLGSQTSQMASLPRGGGGPRPTFCAAPASLDYLVLANCQL